MATPITKEGSADTASMAARLKRVEMAVEYFQPSGGDTSTFATSLTRLYKLTQSGAVSGEDSEIAWDMADGDLQYVGMSTSLHKLVLGEYIADYNLGAIPFVRRVIGGDEQGTRTANGSLLFMTLGNTPWSFEGSRSLAQVMLGSDQIMTEVLEDPESYGSSVLQYLRGMRQAYDLKIMFLENKVEGLQNDNMMMRDRIDILEERINALEG